MKLTTALIEDSQRLVGAKSRFGNPIPVYDDGFGSLYIHRDSMGISGIVRAQKWHDAYAICEDEFFPAADEEAGNELLRIAKEEPACDIAHAHACWDEAYGYRANTRLMSDGTLSSVYAKDLNGDSLELLTPSLLAELEITLEIESE